MIILDTNVVSEPLKLRPDAAAMKWLNRQSPGTLYLTSVSLAELLAGVRALPAGRRRADLQAVMSRELTRLFAGRVLGFGEHAAEAYAQVVTSANAVGNPIDFADAAIGAIAMEHGFALATRNSRDFRGASIRLLNPWD